MYTRHDPDGGRLPIKLDSTSNGEFAPLPLDAVNREANRVARWRAAAAAKRLGLARRDFMISLCGAASTLLAFNAANAAAGRRGGYFSLSPQAAFEPELAQAELGGREFIFDVQGHYVRPGGALALKAGCAAEFDVPTGREYLSCIGADQFIQDVFLDSDTDMMVLSFVPSRRDAEPLTIEEADATRRIVGTLDGSERLLLHGRVNPNQDGDLQAMDELAERWGVAAWKTYTQWGPDGEGYALTDPAGVAFIDNARRLGVKNICIHKGIPFGRRSYRHSLCFDVGPAAKRYPDVNFLIYHSGWIPGQPEGPYDPDRGEGIDSLIRTLQENDIGPHGNVLCRAGQHLARPDARPGQRRPRAGKIAQIPRRRQHTVGYRLGLVRLAAGSDSGVSQLPDCRRAARALRLPGADGRAARQGVRAERGAGLRVVGRRAETKSGPRPAGDTQGELSAAP